MQAGLGGGRIADKHAADAGLHGGGGQQQQQKWAWAGLGSSNKVRPEGMALSEGTQVVEMQRGSGAVTSFTEPPQGVDGITRVTPRVVKAQAMPPVA